MMQGGTADELMAQEKTDSLVSKLHRILTPFVLRRTKLGVLPPDALPPKREVVVFCGMTQVSSSMSPYAYLPMLTHLVCHHTLTYQFHLCLLRHDSAPALAVRNDSHAPLAQRTVAGRSDGL